MWALPAAAAALLVFLPALRFPFFPFWDDDIHVHANPHLAELSWESVAALWSGPWQQLYIPLTYTVWAGLAVISRWSAGAPLANGALDAAWFHGANILLHAGAAVLVFLLVRRIAAAARPGAAGETDRAAAVAAAFFALHPLQVEPVAWISGLRDVLGGVLGLAALLVLFGGPRLTGIRWTAATLLFLASLASKPAGVALPLVAGVLAGAPFRWTWREMATRLGPWLLIGAAWVAVTTRAQWAAALATDLVPWWARPLVALDAVAFYLGKTLLPLGLAADYGRAPDTALAAGWLWWTWLLPVALATVLAAVRPLRIYLVPLAVFVAALLPTLGLVPFNFQLVSTVADRYAYLALLGPALAVALAVTQVGRGWFTAAAALWVAALAWSSAQRLPLWSEDLRLFAATLEVNPRSWKARHNYASALDDRGRTADAVPLMREVVAQRPDSAEALNDLAVMLWSLGQHGEALALMRQSVALRPTPGSAGNLAIMEETAGHPAGREAARRILRELGAAP
jgi:tetratricopeptide (TPR) repeat protein